MCRVSVLLAALLAVSTPSARAQALPLAPVGPWQVDFADHTCILTRPFAAGADRRHLALVFLPVSQRVIVRLTSMESVRQARSGTARVSIDGSPVAQDVTLHLQPGAKGVAVRELHLGDFRTNLATTKRQIRVDAAKLGAFELPLGDLSKPLAIVQTCLDDLHKSVGVDPAAVRAVAVQPQWDVFPYLDLPIGTMSLDLLYWVGVDGRVDECRVVKTTLGARRSARLCEDLRKKARFEPARDASGKPIRAPALDRLRTEYRIGMS